MIRARIAISLLAAWLGSTASAAGQLRPLEPLDWALLGSTSTVAVSLGAGTLSGQTAALVGTRGQLIELGNYQLAWRSGRVLLSVSGTAVRSFREEASADGTSTEVGGHRPERRDAGDVRVATTVRLTPRAWSGQATLRFGTRLPTTDDRVGLDRDQTDFFALVGGGLTNGPVLASVEVGVGIHGTRQEAFEQADVVVYNGSLELPRGGWAPRLTVTGQADTFRGWAIQGNENLGEARLGVRVGERYQLRAEYVRGFEQVSPRSGILVSARAVW